MKPIANVLRVSSTLALLAAIASPSVPAAEGITPFDVARVRQVGAAAISPRATHVAYVLSVPRTPLVDDDGNNWSELHVAQLPGGASRPFIAGKVDVSSVQWTPDGDGIAFLSKRDGDKHAALYVIPLGGGEASRVASLGSAISGYSISPDGKRVALVAAEPEDEARKKEQDKGFKQEIYEEDFRRSRVWIASLESTDAKPSALEIEGSITQVRWSPVDERLLIARAPSPLVDDEMMRSRVAIVDARDGKELAKFENPGKLGAVTWSPDGKRIAILAGADLHDPSTSRIMVAPSAGGPLVDPLPGYPGDVTSIAWRAPDALMYVAHQGSWSVLEMLELSGAAKPKTLVPTGGPVMTSLTLSKDGQHAALLASAPNHAAELFAMSHGDPAPRRLTQSNPWLDSKRLAKQEVFPFKARDGLALDGVLVRPLDELPGKRYPLLLTVHGGPEAHVSNGWVTSYSNPGQMAAAQGFAVFYPNYRGSTGRGVAFSKLGQGDAAGKEFDDLVDAVDRLIEIGLVDKAKVAVTGGSYGGYATAWCATRFTDRFAAGVMMVGISNKISKVGTTDIPDEEYYVHALKRPWEDWQDLLERSPIYYAKQSKTPLLILHGKDDPRVFPGQSRELYRHLKMHGNAPVRLVLYPGEGHGNRKAASKLDYSLRMMQWFEHYLRGPGGEPPPHDLDYAEPKAEAPDPVRSS